MSYIPYKNYSPSKTYLLDEIPSNWEIIPMNQFVELVTDYVSNGSFASLRTNVEYKNEEDFAILVRLADNSNNFAGPFVYINEDAYNFLSKSKLFEGDIVLSNTGSIGSIFKVPNLGKPMSLAPNSLLIRFRNQTLADYFFYLFSCDIGRKFLESITTVTTQPKFNKTDFRKLPMLMPPLKEQKQIANYLDKKTAKIDENISKNKKLIELLEEKRTALINEVVTKGLNPDVPMKDSGIEWIGEIPEHWEVVLFKRLFNLIKDGTHGSFERVDDGEPLLSAKNIFNDKINISKTESCISKDDFLSIVSNGFPKKDDLLMTIVGTIGRSCVYDKEFPLAFQRSVSFIRLTHDNPYYYNYFIKSQIFQSQLLIRAKQSAQKGVYLNDIKECLVIRPPFETQIEIAKYLQNRITKINETILKIQENINLLKEYKTSLIHHVVTGKIDVRGEQIE
ncbi:MAG: restriction endonuclease subunit S [Methanobrevibacter sp.]|nr:restriction endonuclease subunit S [Methanobrevibacter sp.]